MRRVELPQLSNYRWERICESVIFKQLLYLGSFLSTRFYVTWAIPNALRITMKTQSFLIIERSLRRIRWGISFGITSKKTLAADGFRSCTRIILFQFWTGRASSQLLDLKLHVSFFDSPSRRQVLGEQLSYFRAARSNLFRTQWSRILDLSIRSLSPVRAAPGKYASYENSWRSSS